MQLATINELKMTSLEIAELTGARHDNVKRTIDNLIGSGIIHKPQIEDCGRINGLGLKQSFETFVFTGPKGKRDSIVVIAQLSPEFTARIVDRWQELEDKVVKLEEMNQRLTNEDELGRLRQEVARERAARFRAEDMFYFEHNALMRIEDKKSFQEQAAAAIDSARQAWSARCDMREENIVLQESLMTLRERHRIALEYVGSDVTLLSK